MRTGDGMRSLPSQGLTIADLVPQMYKGVNPWLWPAAGLSVKAHLLDLERRALVARSGEVWAIHP
jgi:hypothetical protein